MGGGYRIAAAGPAIIPWLRRAFGSGIARGVEYCDNVDFVHSREINDEVGQARNGIFTRTVLRIEPASQRQCAKCLVDRFVNASDHSGRGLRIVLRNEASDFVEVG
jgi:hypothetical protein